MNNFFIEVIEKFCDRVEGKKWEILAIVLMVIPVTLSLQVFSREYHTITGNTERQYLTIMPTMLSVIYAICLHGILFARNIGKYFETGLAILLTALNILWTASFITIFISNETFNIPFLNIPIGSQVLVFIAIVLSLISMRAIAGYIWIILAVLAVFRLSAINEAMGLWGVGYILCAYISIGIQIWKLKLLDFNKDELLYEFRGGTNRVLGDVQRSANLTKKMSNDLLHYTKQNDVIHIEENLNKDISNK